MQASECPDAAPASPGKSRTNRLIDAVDAYLGLRGPFAFGLTAVLVLISLAFSMTALHRAMAPDIPRAVVEARALYEAGEPYAALRTLNEYGYAIDGRLNNVPDALLHDQFKALWLRMMEGHYQEHSRRPYPDIVQALAEKVLHPEALMLAGEILLHHRRIVLLEHARAIERGEPHRLTWDMLHNATTYLPRIMLHVASRFDPDLEDRAYTEAQAAVTRAFDVAPENAADVLAPYYEALSVASSEAAVREALTTLAGPDGHTQLERLLLEPALDALTLVAPQAAKPVAARFDKHLEHTFPAPKRNKLAKSLASRLGMSPYPGQSRGV